MQRARAELTWERTARLTLDTYERALAGTSAEPERLRATTWVGPHRSGGATAAPVAPWGHAAPLLHARAASSARSLPAPAPLRLRRRARSRSWPARAAARRLRPRSAARLRAASMMPARSRSAPTGSRSTSPRRRPRASPRSASRPGTACCSSSTSAPGASPRSRRKAAPPRARSRAPRRSSSRPTTCTSTWRPRPRHPSTSFARQPNGSLVQLAGVAGCISNDAPGGLRHGHLAGRRGRNRDLAGRPLRLRRRLLGRLAARVLARRGHRAPHPARRRGGLPPRRTAPTALRSPASTGPRRSRSHRTGRRSTSPRAPAR